MKSELDARVAIEVMGWEAKPWREGARAKRWFRNDGISTWKGVNDWHPSSDIAAAFEVVAEMQRQGFSYEVYAYANPDTHYAVFCTLNDEGKFDDRANALEMGATPAEAICNAALSALAAVEAGEHNND